MSNRKISVLVVAAALAALPLGPAEATTCGGVLGTQCADSNSLLGHTHGCSTVGTNRVCFIHWHGNSFCNGTTPGTCTGVLNAGSDGFDSDSCAYGALGSCGFGLATPGVTRTFPVGSGSRTSCATLTTTATGATGSASETDGPQCFTYV